MDSCEKNISNYAVVVGDAHFNSLGLIRSLGEKGIGSVFINIDSDGSAEHSKYTLKTVHVGSTDEIADAVKTVVESRGGKPALFPASDAAAIALDAAYGSLSKLAFCPGLSGKAEFYMDKAEMCRVAEECGFTEPETRAMDITSENKARLAAFGLPFIIKPLKSVDGQKTDITICKTREDAVKAADAFFSEGSGYRKVLVQQFVHGENNLMVEYCGCKTKGKKVRCYAQLEKFREYPVDRGSTSYAIIKDSITYIDVEKFDTMLERFGFEGLFDLELKVVDGTPYFMEINFRNGAPSYGFTAAGFNLPFTWYRDCLGNETEINLHTVKIMNEAGDLRHVAEKNISALRWVADFCGADALMLYNRNDKAPFANAYGRLVTKGVSVLRAVKKI